MGISSPISGGLGTACDGLTRGLAKTSQGTVCDAFCLGDEDQSAVHIINASDVTASRHVKKPVNYLKRYSSESDIKFDSLPGTR